MKIFENYEFIILHETKTRIRIKLYNVVVEMLSGLGNNNITSLISVVIGLKRTILLDAQILGLFFREFS